MWTALVRATPTVQFPLEMKRYFSLNVKAAIVTEAYSQEGILKETARKYSISPAQIRRWNKQKVAIGENIQRIGELKIVHPGRAPITNAESLNQLRQFIQILEERHRTISVGMICRELKRLVPEEADTDMNTLRQRMYRFLRKDNIVQRRATHVAQNTRYDQQQIDQFVEYVNEEIHRLCIGPDDIVNIDETNVDFDMTGKVTLARRGTRTVSLQSTGSAARVTVLLGVTMSGTKLKPFLIFKGKPGGRIIREFTQLHYPEGCVYTVQESAWIDETTFSLWIDTIWKPFCANKPITYLIMDKCKVHLMNSIVVQLQNCGTEVDFILAGYTAKLQVLDVGINKPFKDYLRVDYESFMMQNPENKAPSRLHVAKWVANAWESIKEISITNTWKGIGFHKD